jgi:glycosyltransferase involved in cell wall biosynthesis
MNILLIGEYSRLHNSLKEGLEALGHRVVHLGFQDGFKQYPVDIPLEKKWDSGWRKKCKVALFSLFGYDISSYLTYRQFVRIQDQCTNFDVVQLINENSFYCQPNTEQKILAYLFAHNKNVFLLSCGDDYINVKFCFDHPEYKSAAQAYLAGKISDKAFNGVLKFKQANFKKLHDYLYQHIQGVIATDLDYHLPMQGHPMYLGLHPNPVNVDQLDFQPLTIQDKIIIFLGINTLSYYKKGLDAFEAALSIIKQKYTEQVEICLTTNLPYADYITQYNKAHIILDQAYAHDQGYNALEAMAKGKVVFTGAEPEFVQQYQLTEAVNCNASVNVDQLVEGLSYLIENPTELIAIGARARKFIEKEHHYQKIAARYEATWQHTCL